MKNRLSRKKRAVFALLTILLILASLEGAARLHDRFKPSELEDYKQPSANPALGYELIPNYRRLTPNGKREAISINSLGYRGPEFSSAKPPDMTRILCIGDSCTFEGIPESAPYPRLLEDLLNEYATVRYEVINGAVEGYDSSKALERLRNSLAYEPDIVTIYIGWNDLYNSDPEQESSSGQSRWAAFLVSRSRFAAKLRSLIYLRLRPKLKTREPVKTEFYKRFSPKRYRENLRQMIALAREHNAWVLLVTLPSMLGPEISNEALERAQFPHYTNSLADMLVLIDQYNQAIRRTAEETGAPLIDLAKYFDGMEKKERFFSDAIHMYNDAKPIVARAIADSIRN